MSPVQLQHSGGDDFCRLWEISHDATDLPETGEKGFVSRPALVGFERPRLARWHSADQGGRCIAFRADPEPEGRWRRGHLLVLGKQQRVYALTLNQRVQGSNPCTLTNDLRHLA